MSVRSFAVLWISLIEGIFTECSWLEEGPFLCNTNIKCLFILVAAIFTIHISILVCRIKFVHCNITEGQFVVIEDVVAKCSLNSVHIIVMYMYC